MTDEDTIKRAVETEKRIAQLEKENEHLKERVAKLSDAVNTHRHERHERPLFDYV